MTKPPKQNATPKSKTKSKITKTSPAPGSRFTTESVIRDVQRAIEGKNLESMEDLNKYLASMSGPGLKRALREAAPLSSKDEAQELAFAAMQAATEQQARKLAQRALAKDPDCLDAMVVLTRIEATSAEEAIEGLQKATTAGERALGAEFFKENRGHFWGLLETRPYMRARQQLADLLRGEERTQEAIAHYAAMLGLNPNDNQGVRYPLLGAYLAVGTLDGARKLLKDYADDAMAVFAWGRVLERLLSGDLAGAAAALKIARKGNRFVELYLTGKRDFPRELPESYALGSDEEAIICLESIGAAWAEHPETAMWLVGQLVEDKPRTTDKRGGKSRVRRAVQ